MTAQPDLIVPDTLDPLVNNLLNQGWHTQDAFMHRSDIDQLIVELREMEASHQLRPASVGKGAHQTLDPAIRSDCIAWLEPGSCLPAQQRFLDRMEALKTRLNQQLYLGLFDLESHATLYRPGSRYQRHCDNFQGHNSRVITLLLYLNPDWCEEQGGQLRLSLSHATDAEHIDIIPLAGRLLVFLSERFPHEVLPTHRDRLSLTTWFRRRSAF